MPLCHKFEFLTIWPRRFLTLGISPSAAHNALEESVRSYNYIGWCSFHGEVELDTDAENSYVLI